MKTLEWVGPIFPTEFKSFNINLIDGPLSPLAQEMLTRWGQLNEKYSSLKLFQKNFFSDLKYELTPTQKKLKFPDDFQNIIQQLVNSYVKPEPLSDDIKTLHSTCFIDGKESKIMYVVEMPGIYIGRGDSPLSGHWKYRVKSTDVIINAKPGKGPRGYWKKVEWKPETASGGTYKIKIGHDTNYYSDKAFLFSSADAEVNIERNIEKFQKARKLIEKWNEIECHILDGIYSDNPTRRQTALVLFLVQMLGIRIGNEKDTSVSADTVGASTLKVSNIKVTDDTVILDFLGKDSVKDHRELKIHNKFIISAIQECLQNKDKDELIFSLTNSALTEEFLREVVPEATNKLVRTAYGCGLLAYQIQNCEWDNLTDKQFRLQYDKCNMKVAIQLNHHSTIDKKAKKLQDEKAKDKIRLAKQQLESNKIKWANQIDSLDVQISKAKKESVKKELRAKKKAIKSKQLTAIQSFMDLKNSLNFKINVGDIALGTSKANYSTPELAFSLCNYTGKDPSLIYTKALLDKFKWAKNTPKDLWLEYPTISK